MACLMSNRIRLPPCHSGDVTNQSASGRISQEGGEGELTVNAVLTEMGVQTGQQAPSRFSLRLGPHCPCFMLGDTLWQQ